MKRIRMVSLRLVREGSVPYRTRDLENSQAVFELFRQLAEDLDREAMWVVCLNVKKQITCLSQVSVGTLSTAPVHPREVFKLAVVSNADAIITVHNHPSGDPSPSREDRAVTSQLKSAAQVLGVKLLDHLIVGDGRYYSFADKGDL